MTDSRPLFCRFRLQENGQPYPRSSCRACGKTIVTGLGNSCSVGKKDSNRLREPLDQEIIPEFGA